ncbi:glycerol kinase [Labrys sp. KNU-23]|uniref:FGGY family carbohydrate kinase n=1 Tax=Labrys sp. KNU-23 TaxID=2789216 RepID=UPI0011F05B4C|nr:FGGY family carbohydrate kinase [Labrys sp. KNU-23]QEN88665.1 glycerol kinase [Labrys sp. KNU-23]
MANIVAIDQGTTSTRSLVVGEDGTIAIVKAIRHGQHHPNPGWVEHDPEELLANIRICLEAAGPAAAIGLSNQGESCLAWDAVTGKPLSPVIVWQDGRTADLVEGLRAAGKAATVLERAGLPLDPYFSATKFRWMLDNLPEVAKARAAGRLRLGTTDAFFLQRLTGEFATDATTASRTSLMNLATGAWDEELCALFGVPLDSLPPIRQTVAAFGQTHTGPITASLVDQQAALYGHRCRRAGDLKITFGTGAFCLAVTSTLPKAPSLTGGLLPTVAWHIGDRPTYALDGGVYDVGSSIEWAIKTGIAGSVADFHEFRRSPAIERGLVFVPAFSGLACPHWDRTAAPVIIGLTPASDFADLRQALLEGIAFLTCDILAAMEAEVQTGDVIAIDGGLSRSPYFCQFLADSAGKVVALSDFDETTALGTAQLAALGIGVEIPAVSASDRKLYEPRQAPRERWRERFRTAVGRTSGWR